VFVQFLLLYYQALEDSHVITEARWITLQPTTSFASLELLVCRLMMDNTAAYREKLQKYEYFLNDVLREDLKTTLLRRDAVFSQVAEYMELQKILENIVTDVKTGLPRPCIRTQVEIGCNFYVQGEIEDLGKIVVDIGTGIWLPMTLSEAKKYCDDKIAFLNAQIDDLTKEELMLKSRVNVVYSALQELQGL